VIQSLILLIVIGNSGPAQDVRFTTESVRVENYSKAPLQLTLLQVWTKPGTSEEWVETCFQYSVRNNTKKVIDSYSYAVGPEGAKAYVMGKAFVVPKPLQSLIAENCVPNNVHRDERRFLFRLSFVETNSKTVWESEEHKKAMREMERLAKQDHHPNILVK
jgi:hypothetical protein